MISQFPPPRISGASLRRAKIIYRVTKWTTWLLLVGGTILVNIKFNPMHNSPLIAFPDWIRDSIIYLLISLIWPCGDFFALWILRRVGLENALQEKRVIERTVPEPSSLVGAEPCESWIPHRKLRRLTALVFILVWAFVFGLFQFGSIGFESVEITLSYAFLATILATIFTLIYASAAQHPALKRVTSGENMSCDNLLTNPTQSLNE